MIESIKPKGERRIVSLDEALRRVEGYEKPVLEKAIGEDDTFSGNLFVEAGIRQKKMNFCKSLARLKDEGYERHLTPHEYFSLLAGSSGLRSLTSKENLENSVGTWLDAAWRIDLDTLKYYQGPKNMACTISGVKETDLRYGEMVQYYTEGGPIECNETVEIDLTNVPKYNEYRPLMLHELPEKLLYALFKKKLDEIPDELKGPNGAMLVLPPVGELYPIAIDNKISNATGGSTKGVITRAMHHASRGVKAI